MYLEKRQIHQTTVLDCYGRFDEDDHDPFMNVFETLHSEGCNHLIINLTSIYQLDAKVIHLLRFAHEYFTTSSRQLTLVCPLTAARRELDLEEFKAQMGDRVWQDRNAAALIDEAPDAYKPIDVVMADAMDLVEPLYELAQFVNFKGV